MDQIAHLADWSEWVPFEVCISSAPTLPGVYVARETQSLQIIYVGMAGERRGLSPDGKPKGLRGRLNVYASGKALTSGLGEAVFDRALADEAWLSRRLANLRSGTPERAKAWGRLAFERASLEVCWATSEDKTSARLLELKTLNALNDTGLWNRAS